MGKKYDKVLNTYKISIYLEDNSKEIIYPSNIRIKLDINNHTREAIISMPNFSTIKIEDITHPEAPINIESEKITISNIDLGGTDLCNGILTGYIKVMLQDILFSYIDIINCESGINYIDASLFFEHINIRKIAAFYAYVICKNRCYCDIKDIIKQQSNADIIDIYYKISKDGQYIHQELDI